jgi:phenylpropionate dioxygenase-like ring-hydroxylating dioxygenase large terminal subunit
MSEKAARTNRRKRTTAKWLQPYLEATWGIRNHWFPVLFSHELKEDEAKGIRIGGEPILLRRAEGRVYALKDECRHRGVRLSRKPHCLTKDTITCWYHGFTYNLSDGKLRTIVASPDDPLIGKIGIRTYPVEELCGIIFLFLGDEDFAPPPLAHDLPHRRPDDYEYKTGHLLEPDTLAFGIRRECVGNWRLAAESGGDPGHVMIHRNSALLLSLDIGIALGERKTPGAESITLQDRDWPIGVTKIYQNMEFVMENKLLGIKARGANPPIGTVVSMYLPGVLLVENWPIRGLAQWEWYVPVDAGTHVYWQVLSKTCRTPEEREDFEIRYRNAWEGLALKEGFNDDDIDAREAMEPFYENGRGWSEETLFELDEFVVHWRRLVVKHARGIQPPPEAFPAGH